MDDEERRIADEVEDVALPGEKLSLSKSGIPRPMSHTSARPPSKPAPSARVRALSKDDDDVDQNSVEDEEEEEEDEDEDDDQGIQIEGAHFISHFGPKMQHRRDNCCVIRNPLMHAPHERLLPYRANPMLSNDGRSSKSLSLSECSIHDDNLNEKLLDLVQEERDQSYLHLPYKYRRAYDPADFEGLPVSKEMKEMFQYITRYTPQNIDLDTKLRPFIPEFIPAVGDIDAFIKVPQPDGVVDKLGLVVLDEPCAKQTDPTVLDLQLRAISKETTFKSVAVKSLENADKHPKEIDAWIDSISNLHRSKPPPTVHYSRNMPDIETLMQEWPPEFEQTLNEVGIPSADLDCTLEEYVELICGIMDIPVYRSKIQSLHVLFSLFLEFKNSQHFRSLAMNVETKQEEHTEGADRLVIRDD